ncbi:unnamed protein product [Mytilus coruscus]|uniref:Retropepsins domain-containing protein n=1 Tax=Mytilus coruscus TaxID=42192 RepID=A0A6J8DNH3_MYTCO|nr:unnamed protein product [Mytilus coruscus]
MQVVFDQLNVAALIDTCSSINVISKNLFNSISDKLKFSFEQLYNPEIRLANNEKIKVFGTAKLKAIIRDQEQIIDIYILPTVSDLLILGTEYLRTHKVLLDFSDFSYGVKNIHVQTTKKVFIEPNTELLTYGKVLNFVMVDLQGVCSNSQFALHQGLMIAKSLVVVSPNHRVPIKILNASNVRITLPKGKNIAEFTVLSNDSSYVRMSYNTESLKVQNIELVTESIDIVEGQGDPFNPSKFEDTSLNIAAEFCKEFYLSEDLTETQLLQ